MSYPFLGRTQLVFENIDKLQNKCVAVFGLGGVGGHAVEALARSGIGKLIIVDNDIVAESNINRQILATYDSIGLKKTVAAKTRLKDINSDIEVVCYDIFFEENTKHRFDLSCADYIVDAIDTATAKVTLAQLAKELSVPIISCLGTANKVNPLMLTVTDIYRTKDDPLARIMRSKLKKAGIRELKVVYSLEKPIENAHLVANSEEKIDHPNKKVLGSNAFVPAVAGILLAGEVVCDLLKEK